jgi:hypothetical protein
LTSCLDEIAFTCPKNAAWKRASTLSMKNSRVEKRLRSRSMNNSAGQQLSVKNPAEAGFEVTS